MPEQSTGATGPIPAPAAEDPKTPQGSTQAPEPTGAPQANAETQKPAEQTTDPATDNKTEEDKKNLWRENQSLKDKLSSLEEESSKQRTMLKDYVPEAELEAHERNDLETEKAKIQQERQDLDRSRVLEEKLKLPEYRDLEPFRSDIKGTTEEAITKELDDCRAKAEAWKAKGSGNADLPSAGGAKTPGDISSESLKNMSVADMENILPKGQ